VDAKTTQSADISSIGAVNAAIMAAAARYSSGVEEQFSLVQQCIGDATHAAGQMAEIMVTSVHKDVVREKARKKNWLRMETLRLPQNLVNKYKARMSSDYSFPALFRMRGFEGAWLAESPQEPGVRRLRLRDFYDLCFDLFLSTCPLYFESTFKSHLVPKFAAAVVERIPNATCTNCRAPHETGNNTAFWNDIPEYFMLAW